MNKNLSVFSGQKFGAEHETSGDQISGEELYQGELKEGILLSYIMRQ
tara:strand:- start:47279 stop:47419 length:141 start_codon:yes stop_codon:yes gene_type:complete